MYREAVLCKLCQRKYLNLVAPGSDNQVPDKNVPSCSTCNPAASGQMASSKVRFIAEDLSVKDALRYKRVDNDTTEDIKVLH